MSTLHAFKPSIRERVSAEEWQLRQHLAAAYRLMLHDGIHDITHNHIAVRVAGESNAFLIKPLEFSFDEVSASTLQKFDLDGNPLQPDIGPLKGGGLFHAAILKARPDLICTIHTHTEANIAVANRKDGFLMLSQHALRFHNKIAYHDYYGLEGNREILPHIVRDLADKAVLFMRHHGVLVTGPSLGAAFISHHNLERACRDQVATLSGGIENVVPVSQAALDFALRQWSVSTAAGDGGKDWASLLRRAERLFPEHRE